MVRAPPAGLAGRGPGARGAAPAVPPVLSIRQYYASAPSGPTAVDICNRIHPMEHRWGVSNPFYLSN